MPANQPSQNEYWWREVYYEDIHRNHRRPPSERPSRTELFWQRQEPAAWLYELIRRSAEVKRGELPLPGYGIWSSFPMLKALDQASLILLVEKALGFRAVWTYPPPPGRLPRPGYSDPFPAYSLDLFAADAQIENLIHSWLAQQRSKYECERPISSTEKARRSRNRRELPKVFDWRVIENMDHVKGQGEPLSRSMIARKSEAQRLVSSNRDALISAIQEGHDQAQDLLNAIAAAGFTSDGSKLNLDDPLAILDILDESDAFLKSLSGQSDPSFADSVMGLLRELQKPKQ